MNRLGATFASLRGKLWSVIKGPRLRVMRLRAVQPLAAGVTMYVADVDERRVVFAASPRAICLLDRYPTPALAVREEEPRGGG